MLCFALAGAGFAGATAAGTASFCVETGAADAEALATLCDFVSAFVVATGASSAIGAAAAGACASLVEPPRVAITDVSPKTNPAAAAAAIAQPELLRRGGGASDAGGMLA